MGYLLPTNSVPSKYFELLNEAFDLNQPNQKINLLFKYPIEHNLQ